MNTSLYKVQLAPDGRRFEVIESDTLYLFGSFWTREEAQARADALGRVN
ncbi:hypothetical protein [Diaphorobacter sp. LR2014-1]|nr:hypothetical protein [Diaphorobacter sp. LR2014-1]